MINRPPARTHGARRPDIQGLRALAVVLVVLFHAGLTAPGGFAGVDLFFVISGFVITRLLWGELRESGTIALGAFYARRVRRLLPALALVLVVIAMGSLVLQSPLGLQQQTATVGTASSLFSANAALYLQADGGYFALPNASLPLLHMWTLAVEEQFYLFFPLTLLVAWKAAKRLRADPRKVVAGTVVTVIASSFALSLFLTYLGGSHGRTWRNLAFYSSPTRGWQFAAGSLLAIAETRIRTLPAVVAKALGVLGVVLVGFTAYALDGNTPFPGYAALLPTVAAMLLIAAGTASLTGVSRAFAARPLVWIGDVSYGWYLWHWPAIVFTRALWPAANSVELAIVATLSLVPTWASYRFVENPVRFNPRLVGRRVVALGAACCLVPVACFGGLRAFADNPPASVANLQKQGRPHADLTRGCGSGNLPHDTRTSYRCTWRVAHPRGTIFLLGDSNAGQFVEPVVFAARQQRYTVTLASLGSCEFADVLTAGGGYDTGRCRTFVQSWKTYLHSKRAALVIISSESAGALRASDRQLIDPATGRVATTTAAKAALWQRGLRSLLDAITSAGTPVVLAHTVPQFDRFDLRTCPGIQLYLDASRCGTSRTRASADAFGAPARQAENAAARGNPLVTTVDFFDLLCTATRCSTDVDGTWLYRDSSHLSVTGAYRLTPRFAELIHDHARPLRP